jgi:hypothetical protein
MAQQVESLLPFGKGYNMRYALVNKETNKVENIVEWDGDLNTWQPPETHEAVFTEDKPTIDWVWNADIKEYEQVHTVGNVQFGETWDGTKFFEADKPEKPPYPSNEQQSELRRKAYEAEADPIFFLIQRGEATQEEWQDKITEIKERYPYYFDDEGNLLEAQ